MQVPSKTNPRIRVISSGLVVARLCSISDWMIMIEYSRVFPLVKSGKRREGDLNSRGANAPRDHSRVAGMRNHFQSRALPGWAISAYVLPRTSPSL